jgi:hypothetical protein
MSPSLLAPPVQGAPLPHEALAKELRNTPSALAAMLRGVGKGKAQSLMSQFSQAAQLNKGRP